MNRTYINRLIFAALAATMLLIGVIGLPGGATPSSGEVAVEAAVTRMPRPHPVSHRSLPPGLDLLKPRPHPMSHLRSVSSQP